MEWYLSRSWIWFLGFFDFVFVYLAELVDVFYA